MMMDGRRCMIERGRERNRVEGRGEENNTKGVEGRGGRKNGRPEKRNALSVVTAHLRSIQENDLHSVEGHKIFYMRT